MSTTTGRRTKGYRGLPMEGMVARWYAGLRGSESQRAEWRRQATRLTETLPDEARVLEVAPGPGIWPSRWLGWGGFASPGWTSAAPSWGSRARTPAGPG